MTYVEISVNTFETFSELFYFFKSEKKKKNSADIGKSKITIFIVINAPSLICKWIRWPVSQNWPKYSYSCPNVVPRMSFFRAYELWCQNWKPENLLGTNLNPYPNITPRIYQQVFAKYFLQLSIWISSAKKKTEDFLLEFHFWHHLNSYN